MLLAEWVRLCQHPMATDALFHSLSQKVMQVTETDDGRYFFFRLCTENCVNHYLSFRSVSSVHHRRMIHMIDSFTKLISAMVLEEASDKNKIKLLNDALSVMILVLSYHHENRGIEFNQKPFLRLFASLFNEISKIRTNTIDTSALITFSDALYTLQPINFPGFAFSWLQLISCRSFLPQLLVANENNGWMMCQKLIHALLKFLSPLLNNQELPRATKMFYRGTLRVLVVLLHDFPEFLCNNYIIFAQAIPHSCVQLRNLVLSAFPRVMHLPDPFTPDLILELLPESAEEPVFDQSYANILEKDGFKDAIDRFVETKDASFYETLEKHVTGNRSEVLCAFVLYIGAKSTMIKPLEENPAILSYTHLLSKMESESRYTLLSAIADHLRYPNSHTCFFSATFLHIFAEQSELVKEQITR
jgi:CCR4-NOT transcription complex subunit 1